MLDRTHAEPVSHWHQHVLTTIQANHLSSVVASVHPQSSPSSNLEVTCVSREAAEGLAALLAGETPTGVRCHDGPLHRWFEIFILGAPIVVGWSEVLLPRQNQPEPVTAREPWITFVFQDAPNTRGAQDAWTAEPVLGAIPNGTPSLSELRDAS